MLSQKFDKSYYRNASQDLVSNQEQLSVYNSTGNCVVLAGPGSGKSKILTLKLAKILDEDIQKPQGVACLTYNKECAKELKEKLFDLGINESSSIFIDTVHSFCLNHVINPYNHLIETNLPEVIKVATSSEINETMRMTFELTIGKKSEFNSRWVKNFHIHRRTFLDRESSEWDTNDCKIAKWILEYECSLRQQGLIDYDDMVLNALWMIEENKWVQELLLAKFPVIAVDEYQDLGVALDRIIRVLCLQNEIRLIAVGDPDQSIYGFAGARPSLLYDLANQSNILKVRLKKNYRSKGNIVKASIATLLTDRDFVSNREGEGIIRFYKIKNGIDAQCDYICEKIIPEILSRDSSNTLGDIGILYIDKNDGDCIAERVIKEGYPYLRVDGNAPYNKNKLTVWIENCAIWCSGGWVHGKPRLFEIESVFISFCLNLNITERNLETKKLNFFNFLFKYKDSEIGLNEWLDEFHEYVIVELLDSFKENPDIVNEYHKLRKSARDGQLKNFKVSTLTLQLGTKEHLNLYTLHSSKGLEFKYVIIFGLEQGRIPWINVDEEAVNESRRLFYVGITRAKDEIHLLYSGWYYDYKNNIRKCGSSQFVIELKQFVEKNR